MNRSGRWGAQVDGERQHSIINLCIGIADDCEVLEVELRLLDETRPLLTGNRRERPVLHRMGPVTESLEHCVEVESVSHASTLGRLRRHRRHLRERDAYGANR